MKNIKKISDEEFDKYIKSTISEIAGVDFRIVHGKKAQIILPEKIELWNPSIYDLGLAKKVSCHYNPNALVQVFIEKDVYTKYSVYELLLKTKYLEHDSKKLTKAWICIEDDETFRKFVKHLSKQVYRWNN